MNAESLTVNKEREVQVLNGWLMLPVVIALLLGGIGMIVCSIVLGVERMGPPVWSLFVPGVLLIPTTIIMFCGFFTLQPNEARVLILFGAYRGTVRVSGFHWGNPFYSNGGQRGGFAARMAEMQTQINAAKVGTAAPQPKTPSRHKISLRARNLNGDRLKVNDKRGNPIEIAAVIVWRVRDTAQAAFDVDDYENYVRIQSESALRHLASAYAYDHGEDNEVTLRSAVDEVSQALRAELQERLAKAGVQVDEARLTHLAYAPEIAQAMLRRQQAEAVIAARQKIVHGAVSMVEMALRELAEKHVVQLDDERKAAMVSNLMVVLCGESEVHPVVNTGTLYN
ncbi:MAG: SPFH domain-containing protein [Verrucomicrobiia bacterium]|jgi:regulator of protease activity HflC (stomatin/prohibitin superfamily)